MKNRLTYMFKQCAAMLMLLLFVGYYVDVNFFTHAHIINGVTMVHSHVHDKHHHDTKEGGHTTSELTLIASLSSQLLSTGEIASMEILTYDQLLRTLGIEQPLRFTSIHLFYSALRAPPTC